MRKASYLMAAALNQLEKKTEELAACYKRCSKVPAPHAAEHRRCLNKPPS